VATAFEDDDGLVGGYAEQVGDVEKVGVSGFGDRLLRPRERTGQQLRP
jgi:hypothetical protein